MTGWSRKDGQAVWEASGRSRRITLTVDIAYRFAGEHTWFHGRILNVSDSGVLFAPTNLEAGRQIEVSFDTPIVIGSIPPGRLICAAHVVRAIPGGGAAAQFDDWRFLLG